GSGRQRNLLCRSRPAHPQPRTSFTSAAPTYLTSSLARHGGSHHWSSYWSARFPRNQHLDHSAGWLRSHLYHRLHPPLRHRPQRRITHSGKITVIVSRPTILRIVA